MALSYRNGNDALLEKENEIKKILVKKDVDFMINYSGDINQPQSIELYILDNTTRRIFAIDAQF